MDDDRRWNHNIHHHRLIADALPSPCERVLDVGCGEGLLARELATRAGHVVGLDVDEPTVEPARQDPALADVDLVVGDLFTADLAPASFDAVVSVAMLHHVDALPALERMRALVRPGGVVAVVGLARSRYPADGPYDLAGTVATRWYRLTRSYREVSAPMVWPPPQTYAEVRRDAERALPGVRYRRHVLWRYSLVWTKPVDR